MGRGERESVREITPRVQSLVSEEIGEMQCQPRQSPKLRSPSAIPLPSPFKPSYSAIMLNPLFSLPYHPIASSQ